MQKQQGKRLRVGVVGSREYPKCEQVSLFVSCLHQSYIIVSGGAIGVDLAAETLAGARNMKRDIYLPDFKKNGTKYNPADFFKRNAEIVDNCDVLVAFWDGDSPGTRNSLNRARAVGRETKVFKIEDTDQEIAEYADLLNSRRMENEPESGRQHEVRESGPSGQ